MKRLIRSNQKIQLERTVEHPNKRSAGAAFHHWTACMSFLVSFNQILPINKYSAIRAENTKFHRPLNKCLLSDFGNGVT